MPGPVEQDLVICRTCGIPTAPRPNGARTGIPLCVGCYNTKQRQAYAAKINERRAGQRAYTNKNRAKVRAAKRADYYAKPPEARRAARRYRRFGLTAEVWDRIFEQQRLCCAICGSTTPEDGRDWATDHDHATGKVRGILCNPCNKGLGHFRDRPEALRAAAAYLEVHCQR